MTVSGGGAFARVEDFLDLVALLDAGSDNPRRAEAAFRAVVNADLAEREELLFRVGEQFAEEKRRFIEYNNHLVEREFSSRQATRPLILLPFCLQRRTCPHHIAWQLDHCRRCGQCPVGPILDLCDRYGLAVRLAIRSRFAPEFVDEIRPDLVIAVACEHELVQGILRVAPCRCYGICNTQPEGLCKNTQVQQQEIEDAVRLLVRPHS